MLLDVVSRAFPRNAKEINMRRAISYFYAASASS
jgi:hypothetical protein